MALPVDKLLDENTNRYYMTVAAIDIAEQISKRYNAQGGQDVDDTEKIAIKALNRLFEGNLEIIQKIPEKKITINE